MDHEDMQTPAAMDDDDDKEERHELCQRTADLQLIETNPNSSSAGQKPNRESRKYIPSAHERAKRGRE